MVLKSSNCDFISTDKPKCYSLRPIIKHIFALSFTIYLCLFSVALAQWNYIGLGNKKINKLRIHNQILYATTDDGVYCRNIYSSDTIWISMGLQGKETYAISILNSDTIYTGIRISGLGSDTISIYRTINGGVNWESYQNGFGGGTGHNNQVFTLEASPYQNETLFATGSMQIAKSNNLGENWQLVWGNWAGNGMGVHFIAFDPVSSNVAWSGGESGYFQPVLLKSTDFGENWQENWINVGGDNACYSCAVDPSNSNVIYIGMEGRIIKTTDGGENWNTIYSPMNYPYFYGIAMNSNFSNIIYASGSRNTLDPQYLVLHKSQDNGISWSTIVEGSAGEKGVLDLLLVSGNNVDTFYLATFGSGVYRYEETVTNIETIDSPKNHEFFLLKQNYPNPFEKITEIRYQIPKQVNSRQNPVVSMNIYDVTGRLVKTLVNETQELGYYQVLWDGKDDLDNAVSSGIYFYRIEAGNFTAMKKIVKTR